jgi:Uma2 family endonuclease
MPGSSGPTAYTTHAAEGLRRRRWSVAELEAMVAAGILSEDERIELIGGEVVLMSPKGNRHEILKRALLRLLFEKLPVDCDFLPETTLRLDRDTFCEPDILVFPRNLSVPELTPETALLVVEIADRTLAYDLGPKADLYAKYGVRELWVIDAIGLTTRTHREPSLTGYRRAVDWHASDTLTPSLIPGLELTLSSFDLR